jgi:3-deoxy-manno-octulosonate cytidylyltransferase (CMP-KDO synthetase)
VSLSGILDDVLVATDSEEIASVIANIGGKAIITGAHHETGIERLCEIEHSIDCDVVVLVNGDEVLLDPAHISDSVNALMDSDAPTSLLVSKSEQEDDPSNFKVVLNRFNEVMYFSRGDIPSNARKPVPFRYKAYHIISFRKDFLKIYQGLEKTPLERIEGHDHLRMLEHGIKVQAAIVDYAHFSVDTEEDLNSARREMRADPFFALYEASR